MDPDKKPELGIAFHLRDQGDLRAVLLAESPALAKPKNCCPQISQIGADQKGDFQSVPDESV